MSKDLEEIPIVVLCGGLGTRLQPVLDDRPKILAPLGSKTLLDYIITMLNRAGFQKIILGIGHLKEKIKAHVLNNQYGVIFSEENRPLGTGGALKAALRYVDGDLFFTMNGDMIFNPDFSLLHRFHLEKKALMSFFITRGYIGDGGNVITVDNNHRVTLWRDRTAEDKPEKLHLNAGTYLMNKEIAKFFPERGVFSLEKDVFPQILLSEACYGYRTDNVFIDIGVPERYEIAQKLLESNFSPSQANV